MKIETKVARAKKKIADGHKELQAVQTECTHPNLEGSYGANTGNWCESGDSYWLDLSCPTCGKKWSIDNKEPEYRMYGEQSWNTYKCKMIRK